MMFLILSYSAFVFCSKIVFLKYCFSSSNVLTLGKPKVLIISGVNSVLEELVMFKISTSNLASLFANSLYSSGSVNVIVNLSPFLWLINCSSKPGIKSPLPIVNL